MPEQSTSCRCGCDQLPKMGNAFVHGHNLRGRTRPDRSIPLAQRFWPKVNKNGPIPEECPELGACWVWTGFIDKGGYGRINLGRRESGIGYAHHVSLTLLGAPVPEGFDRDHLCRRRHCCRPSHLDPVPHRINVMRGENEMVVLSRAGLCAQGHEATDENVYRRKATGAIVYCRPCRRAKRAASA